MPCAKSEKVVTDLIAEVAKENRQLPSAPLFSQLSKDCVQATQRDESIQHLLKVSVHFGFEPETFCLAVKYVDTFLGKIKVHPKYLEVVSLTSLVLAAKISEEEEFIPDVEDFVTVSRSSCSAADVVRMERVMLDKLEWDMMLPTPLTFLEKFCNILGAFGYFHEEQKRSIVQHAVPTLLQLLTDHSFLVHKSSTVALTILSYELSFFNQPSISESFTELAGYANIMDSELTHCYSLLQDFLELQLLSMCKDKRKKKKRTHSNSSSVSARTMPTIWESGDEIMDQNSCMDLDEDVTSDESYDDEQYFQDLEAADEEYLEGDEEEPAVEMEFPDIWETIPKHKRKADPSNSPTSLSNTFFGESKPLYSAVVKKSSSTKYETQLCNIQRSNTVNSGRAF